MKLPNRLLLAIFITLLSFSSVQAKEIMGQCCDPNQNAEEQCGAGATCEAPVSSECEAEEFGGECFITPAQSRSSSLFQFQQDVKSEKVNANKWMFEQGVTAVEHSFNTQFWGTYPGIEIAGVPSGGAIGATGNLVAYLVGNPPVSTGEYLADLGSNIGLPIKSAYAQGTGWEALRPVLPIWKAFRNIAYMAFVIIFIAIGFMIMFRAKINPQTVISIQAALPKVVITLLLVTFSYAIAGLMIDLIYIGIYLVVGIFSLGDLITNAQAVTELLFSKNFHTFVYIEGNNLFMEAPAVAVENLVGGILGVDWARDLEQASNLNIFGGIVKLVLGVAVLFSVFKLFFSLLLSYLGIIIGVIFAPFNILFNALPGSTAFTNWLKTLFANVIVFPVVAAMFLIAAVLIGPRGAHNPYDVNPDVGFYPSFETESIWVPPFMVVGDSGVGANTFQALIALGIIMMMPQIVGKVKKMLKVEPSGFGAAIMGGIMAGPSAVGGFAQQAWNLQSQITQMRLHKEQRDAYESMKTHYGGGGKK